VPLAVLAFLVLEALLAWSLWRTLSPSDLAFARKLGLISQPRPAPLRWIQAAVLVTLMAALGWAAWLLFVSKGGIVFACAQDTRFCP
jgi:hypothetical protein